METRYFHLLDQLADFGEDLCRSRIDPETWHEYLHAGFDESYVPDLIRILGDESVHESEFAGTAMASIHVWRILAELKAVEAIPALISLLPRTDDTFDDWTGEELPDVFSKIGPVSLEAIELYARDTRNGDSSRICSFRLISKIGCVHLEQRARCIEILTDMLRAYETNDDTINAFLISSLSDLGALESFDLVREAYQRNRVDLMIQGDAHEAERHFKIARGDEDAIAAMAAITEERLLRLRGLATMAYPFEPAQIVDRPRPIVAEPKVGRNEPCPCGSGKKYKKCCGSGNCPAVMR
ncbi:hypothetical protein R69746_08239 [Paraburkholderia aspalathi]|nr:hypothetical protein R69746_08239 [Paraburkholderia aspalathi]CAE6869904.1 hypothetical protein R75465_08211 [Paraburkholderia aspalathi]